jgi:predicted HTH domain antitoxin
MVNVQLDDDLVAVMQLAEEPIDRLTRESIVLELYRRGTISSGKAGQLLGMPRFDFVRYASRLGIPFFNLTEEELDAELRTFDEIARS